jgi:hypothetical protein
MLMIFCFPRIRTNLPDLMNGQFKSGGGLTPSELSKLPTFHYISKKSSVSNLPKSKSDSFLQEPSHTRIKTTHSLSYITSSKENNHKRTKNNITTSKDTSSTNFHLIPTLNTLPHMMESFIYNKTTRSRISTCAICLTDYEFNETLRYLPLCTHTYVTPSNKEKYVTLYNLGVV